MPVRRWGCCGGGHGSSFARPPPVAARAGEAGWSSGDAWCSSVSDTSGGSRVARPPRTIKKTSGGRTRAPLPDPRDRRPGRAEPGDRRPGAERRAGGAPEHRRPGPAGHRRPRPPARPGAARRPDVPRRPGDAGAGSVQLVRAVRPGGRAARAAAGGDPQPLPPARGGTPRRARPDPGRRSAGAARPACCSRPPTTLPSSTPSTGCTSRASPWSPWSPTCRSARGSPTWASTTAPPAPPRPTWSPTCRRPVDRRCSSP